LKVHVESSGLSTFPDATVVCDSLRTAPFDRNAAINPTILVEVTSRATEAYDRGEKLRHYERISSLRAVLIVSHRSPRITVVTRVDDGFESRDAGPGEPVRLASPALDLAVDDVYRAITLDGE
jgi:Uma2 family endonuclease